MIEPNMREPKIGSVQLGAELSERLLGFLDDLRQRLELPFEVVVGAEELWAWMEEELREGAIQ